MSNTATRFRVYRRGQVDCDASFSTLAGAMDWAIQHCRTVNEMAVLYIEDRMARKGRTDEWAFSTKGMGFVAVHTRRRVMA